jgi:trk system potassium uptake protein
VVRSGRKTHVHLSLHTKLVLTTTGCLLVAGTALFLLMEWNNTLAKLAFPERFLASFFQSVTPRTAGFNTLPYGAMANQTLFVTVLLMFIGASSGSTGGGIKTGTFATLVALGWSRFRGYEHPQVFHRSISAGSVGRAMSVTMVCALLVVLGTLILQVTEIGAGPQAAGGRDKFLELLFEVTSAFGTVGLSTGVTPSLTDLGKLLITFVMFLGRLGPLVVAVAVSGQKTMRYRHAEESIMIG